MATAHTLEQCGELVALGGGLDDDEQPCRLIYALPHVIDWLRGTLPTVRPFYPDTELTPTEQLDALLHDYVSGADLAYYERSHSLHPEKQGIWELKTLDIRLIGWFYAKNIFIVANIDTMERIKTYDLYHGYLTDTQRKRDLLDLDDPKYVDGSYEYVF